MLEGNGQRRPTAEELFRMYREEMKKNRCTRDYYNDHKKKKNNYDADDADCYCE